jgi:ankyrin repeat protein
MTTNERYAAFIEASVWQGSLERGNAILGMDPEVADIDIHVAAILGNDDAVRRFLAEDPAAARRRGGPRGWDALTHLCFSNYLRLDPARSDAFVRAARALLDAGASAQTGFWAIDHEPEPEWESAIYGAAGVAHHPELTALLLQRGADPNDNETPYHTPETYDNRAMEVLVESGALTADSLATLLLRKTDWHDYDGIKWLLERGVSPNRTTAFGKTALHNAVLSDNGLPIVELLLDHGADPRAPVARGDSIRGAEPGQSSTSIAAWRGRGDVLDLFERRGYSIELQGAERLSAACARNDTAAVRAIAAAEPGWRAVLDAQAGMLLAQFAGNGNTEGVRQLLDLGLDPAARFTRGNAYMDIAKESTALHAAAWLARHDTVRLLVERAAPVNVRDAAGRTPLALAVRAAVDSYWTRRRSPESTRALLEAGASVVGVTYPSGYQPIDDLLSAHGARARS